MCNNIFNIYINLMDDTLTKYYKCVKGGRDEGGCKNERVRRILDLMAIMVPSHVFLHHHDSHKLT